jgi:hypothetical protein
LASRAASTVLILGGAGMVGLQAAREVAREINPRRIVIASLREEEVADAILFLKEEITGPQLAGEWGNIFVPDALRLAARDALFADSGNYDLLFDSVFRRESNYRESALFKLVEKYQPEIVIDCINTATGISYQNEFDVAIKTKEMLDALSKREGAVPREELEPFFKTVRELLISQGIPQIARHILVLHQTLEDTAVQIYLKVGTTGTGGMGLNIPYTHSEDKPSLPLLAKSAIGFAHTGLLFLLARTPAASEEQHGAIVKEVKPGAMIGFRRLDKKHVTLRGEREKAYLLTPREEPVGDRLELQQDAAGYQKLDGRDVPLEIIGADTGENGFFSIGEFLAITYPRQMEYVTPEEVARTAILEILGASTGRDVLAAIDGAITEPSYRAGVMREHAVREMHRLESEKSGEVPSIAIGHLGPPKLSKLLAEAHLIREAAGTADIPAIRAIAPADMQRRVSEYLDANPVVAGTIVRIGTPILRERDAKLTLTRGPRISIPPVTAGHTVAALTPADVERYAKAGWVDLRLANFEAWQRRLARIKQRDVERYGSAALDVRGYPGAEFVPGDIVGWIFTNEEDEQGMIGRRLL